MTDRCWQRPTNGWTAVSNGRGVSEVKKKAKTLKRDIWILKWSCYPVDSSQKCIFVSKACHSLSFRSSFLTWTVGKHGGARQGSPSISNRWSILEVGRSHWMSMALLRLTLLPAFLPLHTAVCVQNIWCPYLSLRSSFFLSTMQSHYCGIQGGQMHLSRSSSTHLLENVSMIMKGEGFYLL